MRTNQIITTILLFSAVVTGISQSSKQATGSAPPASTQISAGARAAFGTETVMIKQPETFPQSWFGEYEGTLNIYRSTGAPQSVPMKILIDRTDSAGVYKWHIIYGEDQSKGLRPYLLRTIDAKKGIYQCDELNTIKMESYYVGNKLFCHYAVEGNDLTTVEEKGGDTLTFEIIFGKESAVSETGGAKEKTNTEKIPTVKTFPVVIYQKAVLKKIK